MVENSNGYSCPICLVEEGDGENDVSMVVGPCQHPICLPCVKRVLSAPTAATQTNRANFQTGIVPSQDILRNLPTFGQCPICRSGLSLFDLKEKGKEGRFVIGKNHNIGHSDLAGRTYVKSRAKVGNESFHFPSLDTDKNGDDHEKAWPFLNLTENGFRLDDGSAIPDKKYFDKDCHFHDQTRTFHGSILWEENGDCRKRLQGSHRWDYVLAFSSDYRFIARGVLVAKRRICRDKECSNLDCKFPMDGRWRVEYPDSEGKPPSTVVVHGNQFQFENTTSQFLDDAELPIHRIEFNGENPTILWGERQEKQGSNNLVRSGQADASSISIIIWDATFTLGVSLRHPKMVWTRETTTSESVPLQMVTFGQRNMYHCLLPNSPSGTAAPEYIPDTVWGNTFGQGLSVGLASYHFMSDGSGAYICYEHEDTAMWPPLDNGSPVPTKMWFSNYSFDAENRIFSGYIHWESTHGTTWQGSRIWRYEMKFADDYSCIIGGQVVSRRGSGEESEMGKFGVRLVYVNVGMLEQMSNSSPDPNEHRRKLVELAEGVREQIEVDPNATEEAMVKIMRLKSLIISSSHIPISYPSTYA